MRKSPPSFVRTLGAASLLLSVALGLGVIGYHVVAKLGWIDALLNASMILTGIGRGEELGGVGSENRDRSHAGENH